MFISSMEWLKKEEDILYNSQFFLDDTGVLLGTYRKVHLFDSEKNYFTPGDQEFWQLLERMRHNR